MNRSHKKEIVMLLSCVALLMAIVGVGATYYKTVDLDNDFQVAQPKVYMSEKFDPIDKWVPGEMKEKVVKFGNAGDVDCYLRAKFVEVIELADGTEVAIPNGFGLNFATNFSSKWTDGGDGWYYYNEVLAAGETTEKTLESVTISDAISNDAHGIKTDFSGSKFTVRVKAEFVQALNAADAETEAVRNGADPWAVTPWQ